jgi:hypothetical protein
MELVSYNAFYSCILWYVEERFVSETITQKGETRRKGRKQTESVSISLLFADHYGACR